MKCRHRDLDETVGLPVANPATATGIEHQDAESSAMKGTGKPL
jgi:hypothetical protein